MKKFISFLVRTAFTLALCAVILAVGFSAFRSSDYYKWYQTDAVETADFGSPHKFYFKKLNNLEKHVYNEILTQIYGMPESIEIPAIDAKQLDRVFSALLYDNPDLFFVGRKCTLSSYMMKTFCSVEYIVEKEEYESLRSELMSSAERVIASLTKPDDEWQTELEIHDYIIENCRYELDEPKLVRSSAYGALVEGRAACEGYSKAAKLLFDMAGIESALVSGDATDSDGSRSAHMWNAVKINGDFYFLDCTWDDPVNDEKKDIRIYSYFNVNNKMISETHSGFSYPFICTATAENYYVKTGRFFEKYDRSKENAVAELIAKEIDSGNWEIQLRFGSKNVYKKAVEDLIDNGRIYGVLSKADEKTSKRISLKSIVYYKDPGQLMLTLIPESK